MVNFTILAGGFAVPGFIATYNFDSVAKTLNLVGQSETGNSPSWIASHPANQSILYAVNEVSPVGSLQSFLVGQDGALTLQDTISTEGNGPTFTNPLSTGEITGMNFGSPNASFAATDPNDPTRFVVDSSQVVSFPVPEGVPSNPHMSLEHNGEIFIPDLGQDKIWRVVKEGDAFKVQGQIDIDAGAGPRHIAIRDNILFTLHEKTSTLTAQEIPAAPNGTAFPLIANVSIIPSNPLNGTKFAAAEILISEPSEQFPNPLIYVSNRNIGETIDPNGDTIAVFEFTNGTSSSTDGTSNNGTSTNGTIPTKGNPASNGAATDRIITILDARRRMFKRKRGYMTNKVLSTAAGTNGTETGNSTTTAGGNSTATGSVTGALNLLAQVPTGLQQIRSMALSGDGEFIIAGANTQGGVAIFQRVDGGKNLTLVARNEDLQNRTSFVFL